MIQIPHQSVAAVKGLETGSVLLKTIHLLAVAAAAGFEVGFAPSRINHQVVAAVAIGFGTGFGTGFAPMLKTNRRFVAVAVAVAELCLLRRDLRLAADLAAN